MARQPKAITPAVAEAIDIVEQRLAARPEYTIALMSSREVVTVYKKIYRHIANAREAGAHMQETMELNPKFKLVLRMNGETIEDAPTLETWRGQAA